MTSIMNAGLVLCGAACAAAALGWALRRRKPGQLGRLPAQYTVIDIETTGLNPDTDAIIELAAIKVRACDEHPYATHAALVNPGRPVPALITQLTGINDAMLAGRRGVAEEMAALLDFAGSDTLVFYYASFDLQFLRRAARAIGREITNPVIDAVPIARWAFPRAPDHKLTTLTGILGHSVEGAHRALHDCISTLRVIRHAQALAQPRDRARAETHQACSEQKSMRK